MVAAFRLICLLVVASSATGHLKAQLRIDEQGSVSVSGKVLGSDGKPLSDMHVALKANVYQQLVMGYRRIDDVLARAKSDAQGSFEFRDVAIPPWMSLRVDDLRDGKGSLCVVAWGEGHGVSWQSVSQPETKDLEMRLAPQADVSGLIVKESGEPIDGARLSVIELAAAVDSDDVRRGNAQELLLGTSAHLSFSAETVGGKFTLSNMPRDVWILVCCVGRAGRESRFLINTTADDNGDGKSIRRASRHLVKAYRPPVRVELQQKPWVQVRVVDHNGKPISGGGVEAIAAFQRFVGYADVDDRGHAVLTFAIPGNYELRYGQNPSTPTLGVSDVVRLPEQNGQTVVLKLFETKQVSGRVIDGDTGEPIVGVYAQARNPKLSNQMPPRPTESACVTAENGVFRLPIASGIWNHLSVRHDVAGYFAPTPDNTRGSPPPDRVPVTDKQIPEDLTIKLARGLVVRGIVTDGRGKALAGVTVEARNTKSPFKTANTISDQDGKFTMSALSPFVATRVSASNDDAADQYIIAGDQYHPWDKSRFETIVLRLTPDTVLTGRVVQDGKPAKGVKMILWRSLPPKTDDDGKSSYLPFATVVTDDQGRYRVAGLKKGDRYWFEIEPQGHLAVRDWDYQSPNVRTIRKENGATITLPDARMVVNTQQLRGVVVDPDGKPVSGIQVSARLASGRHLARPEKGPPPWTKTDGRGRFHLTQLPAEPIELMAYRRFPGVSTIHYPAKVQPKLNDQEIRIVLDPRLGTGIENLDE